ncbi:hypothetical protein FA95DRAFT_1557047 [Auriscalpium vulgare]|uniref:Uncharacterized protein n=1 Tax=Auriscalpium vulgare TaxID=40419 RepID=A0ACB8RZF7_9AGAM|nr:hypothetical protein FA95DRAFT_1557047 [Auriscalpium vulgare]
MSFTPALVARRPALLLFVGIESLIGYGVWRQYRNQPSMLTAKPKSHIPPAKWFL